jgi:hypothetical protein
MVTSKETEETLVDAQGSDTLAESESLHSDAAANRKEFLSSFSPEDKAVRRKVDWRFLWLIGMMYIIKSVSDSDN